MKESRKADMNANSSSTNLIYKLYLFNTADRIAAIAIAVFVVLFFASSTVLAGTSLPKTPSGREDYYQFLGIDVSEWQGDINWNGIKADGVDYAFIRAGATTSSSFDLKEDRKFDINMQGSGSAGVARGLYWYSQATTEEEAVAEAKKLVAQAKKYDVELPLVMDLEFSNGRFDKAYNSWRARGSAYARQRMTSVAEAFLSYCRSQGYPASIYLSTSLAGSFSGVDTKSLADNSYEVWVAHYSNELSAYPEYNVWQFTSTGRMQGIKGNVDCDAMYVDKSARKAGNPGLDAEPANTMVRYTGAPATTNVNVSDNGKALTLNKDYTVSYMNNNGKGTAYALIKGKGTYVGYTEVFPYQIGDEELLHSADLEPSQAVTGIKNGKTYVKFTAAGGDVDDYRIEYRNDDSEEWKAVRTGGKAEYALDGQYKQIRVSAVVGGQLYGMALPDNSQKYEIIDGSVESDYRLGGKALCNRDKFKKINKEVSEDVVI